jgi:hypothetical protein
MLSRTALRFPIGSRILATASLSMSFHSLSATKGNGETIAMGEFQGKVVYATNVASK